MPVGRLFCTYSLPGCALAQCLALVQDALCVVDASCLFLIQVPNVLSFCCAAGLQVSWSDASVVELGAGLGLPSLFLAKLGSKVECIVPGFRCTPKISKT